MSGTGRVWLVGAGPGDPELITRKGARVLGEADVVVHDRLVDARILDLARPGAERIFAGKQRANHFMRQVEINELLVRRALAGQRVVRLKGGDPLVFGRGGEELDALREAGVPVEIVPGVTAASGCAATAAIPLTHRDHAQAVVLVTGHTRNGEPDLNWQALCQPRQTLVFYMGYKALGALFDRLIAEGLPADLPAAMVENGTLPDARILRGTLSSLPTLVADHDLTGPATIIVGEVAALGAPADLIAGAAELQRTGA